MVSILTCNLLRFHFVIVTWELHRIVNYVSCMKKKKKKNFSEIGRARLCGDLAVGIPQNWVGGTARRIVQEKRFEA